MPRSLPGTVHRLSIHQDFAGIGMIESGDQAQESRLAASGRTQQNAEFADIAPFARVRIFNFEIDVLEGIDVLAPSAETKSG